MAEIAAKTNASISNDSQETQELEGAIFEETAGNYRSLRIRSEEVICDTLIYHVRDVLRPYARINPWASLSATGSGSESSLTAETRHAQAAKDVLRQSHGKVEGET